MSQEGIMVAYLIIAVELSILYGVFWTVFIREPNSPTVKGGLWGSYGQEFEGYTTYGAGDQLPVQLIDQINDRELETYYAHHWDMDPSSAARRTRHQGNVVRNRSQRASMRRFQQLRYGWVSSELIEDEKTMVGKLFQNLSRAINQLSVKLP
jgi:hypothetical protein